MLIPVLVLYVMELLAILGLCSSAYLCSRGV
jgi:hypothetical protein